MKTFAFACIVLIIMFTAALPVHCQGEDRLVDGKTVDGKVVSVDTSNSKIVVKSSEAITLSVSSDAKIINKDGFSIQLSDVTAGNYVTADYHDDASGNHIIDSMEVEYQR